MRIALFTEVFLPKIDGITNRLASTLRELRKSGHEVRIFAPEGTAACFEGYRVTHVPALRFPPYPGLRAAVPDPRLLWELWRFGPDVAHVVGPTCLGVWGSMAARALGLPLLASFHTDYQRYLPSYGLGWLDRVLWPTLRQVHGMAHANLCPSSFTRRELESHGIEIHGLWPGGVDTQRFRPEKRDPK